ncbi:MAG TPA: hypothetical protein ENJ37_05095 [Deltaproteobacteria bacterium]|nr:hypothetical protein [Deltaproteobacteria bacterium]
MTKSRLLRLLIVLTTVSSLAAGCSGRGRVREGQIPFVVADDDRTIADYRVKEDAYRLVPGDVVQVLVYNQKELSMKIRIPPSGVITYPFIGDIEARGLTVQELRDRIAEGLASGYVKRPQVAVNLDTVKGRKVYILGEVTTPKVLPLTDEMDVVEALSLAGGFTPSADRENVFIIRKIADGRRVMDVVNIQAFLKELDFSQNVMLQGGDVVYVSRSLIGDVAVFMRHLYTITMPVMPNLMEGIILTPRVYDTLQGKRERVFID